MAKYSVRKEASPDLVKHLLFHRGVSEEGEILKFLSPDYVKHTHNPFLMKGIAEAVQRTASAIVSGEKIAIWSDYDADGIPGAVVLHDFFKKIGYEHFQNYIPNRAVEGFGLNIDGVKELSQSGVKLIITIDCGISDVKEVEQANTLGINVIITDHHLPGEKLPKAFAIINPKQSGCEYPEKMLCGSGVIFKFVQALLKDPEIQKYISGKGIEIKEGWEKWLLDMVGIATLSDMVPLVGENRMFAYFGLMVLRKSPRVGLSKLLRKLKISQKDVTEDDIGFMISPRINAASRMGVPSDAFKLLSTSDEGEAGALADHLDKINNERKGTVAAMVKEIRKKMESRLIRSTIVMGNPSWRPTLLGLAANTLMREHARPVFLWGREGGEIIKGSCRSDGSVSVMDIMQSTPEGTFLDFGGHAASGGFSVSNEKIHFLEEALESAYQKVIEGKPNIADTEIMIDKEISLNDVSWNMYGQLEKLAPFGEGNPKPLFLISKSKVQSAKMFGKENNHFELTLVNSSGKIIKGICFFVQDSPFISKINPDNLATLSDTSINIIASLEKSMFRNYPELRLRIVDII